MQAVELSMLIDGWDRSLEAAGKADKTRQTYRESATQFVAFLQEHGLPTQAQLITREHVELFVVDLRRRWKPATANNRYRGLAQLFRYLLDEGEIADSPMARTRPPRVPEVSVPVLTEIELKRLLAACEGAGFTERRDMAMVRLLVDTGMRAGELVGMSVVDLDLKAKVAFVVGKGSRPRACPYGSKTAAAIDRYLRARARHTFADLRPLFVGPRGAITDSGLRQVVEKRGLQADIAGLHPHQLRHTYAHRFLSEGGQESDLMLLAGWRSRQMLQRYGASAAAERARDAYRRLGLGDLL
jgi:site-specific recombinase XerD